MDFIRIIISAIFAILFSGLFVKLILQRKNYHNYRIKYSISNNGNVIIKKQGLSLYKKNDFFKMINAGDDLFHDDISFEYNDYCGSLNRMYYSDGGVEDETVD